MTNKYKFSIYLNDLPQYLKGAPADEIDVEFRKYIMGELDTFDSHEYFWQWFEACHALDVCLCEYPSEK